MLEIETNLKDKKSGKPYIDVDKMKNMLAARKSIKKYAWIIHDKDVYVEDDIAKLEGIKDKSIEVGQPKAEHIHCVMYFNPAQKLSTVAKWFGVKPQYIQLAKVDSGDDFLAKVEYLTHESENQQKLGKHLYSDDEVHSNFDFRKELSDRKSNKETYGVASPSRKLKYRIDVLRHGKSLREIAEENIVAYNDDMDKLKKNRLEYLAMFCPMPKVRLNFYIEGRGGVGKGLASKALARALIDKDNTMKDSEIFFEVGSDNDTFEGYDGQPVIIWNDCRCDTLLFKLGGRENVFNTFDPFPPNIKQNIKYGSVKLVNRINIINSVQSWSNFLDGLAGEYMNKKTGKMETAEDKGQSYRRFPLVISLHETNFDLLVNKGVCDGSRNFTSWNTYMGIAGNFQRISETCGDNENLKRIICAKTLDVVCKQFLDLHNKLNHDTEKTDEEIIDMFACYGAEKEIGFEEIKERFIYFVKDKVSKDIEDLYNEFSDIYKFGLSFEESQELLTIGNQIQEENSRL